MPATVAARTRTAATSAARSVARASTVNGGRPSERRRQTRSVGHQEPPDLVCLAIRQLIWLRRRLS